MHHIQRHILKVLSRAKYARFRDMRPPRVDSNTYSYHLRVMQREGYIVKAAEGYTLGTKGLQYVDGLKPDDLTPLEKPKVIVILALRNSRGEWLMAERKIQPYIGTVMFPSGSQHKGETPSECVARKIREKTGLRNLPMKYRGMADVQIHDGAGVLLTHVIANVYEGKLPNDVQPPEDDRFRYVWSNFQKGTNQTMAGNRELYKALRSEGVFNICIKRESTL